jgi:tetraacyldisaccharide 4'-kinase
MTSLNVRWKLKKTNLKRYINSKYLSFLNGLWKRDSFFSFSLLQKIIFLFLCACEKFYLIGFRIDQLLKKRRVSQFPLKIISVGNLSTGGVGKSVFVRFLVENLDLASSIVLRGYRGKNEKNKRSFLVSDGQNVFCDVNFAGDEAFMFCSLLKVPVVIGASKNLSCELLVDFSRKREKKIDCVILDDGYQSSYIKKDAEILLLDARRPFGNEHCIPAGPLREKDLSRANLIVFTHSDEVNKSKLLEIQKLIFKKNFRKPVFFGKHVCKSFLDSDLNKVSKYTFKKKKVLIFAGIGSFSSFFDTAKNIGINIVFPISYPNHHSYTIEDIEYIIKCFERCGADSILTTQKDWHKISSLISKFEDKKLYFYSLDIDFEFLYKDNHCNFFNLLVPMLK